MKKFLLLAAAILVSAMAFAKDYLYPTFGDISVLKDKANTIFVQFDYTQATVSGINFFEWQKARGEEWVRDWPREEAEIRDYFTRYFNKKNKKGAALVSDPAIATHKMIITPSMIDMGNTGGAFVPGFNPKSGGAVLWGTIEVLDNRTGQTVLVLKMDEIRGNSGYSETIRLKLAVYDLAGELAGLK
ncbi:MAG: hypothetical protein IKP46_01975 [Bacteroidales bacterium]|nr:hypothetical protein [Bacteroidales bacterium]